MLIEQSTSRFKLSGLSVAGLYAPQAAPRPNDDRVVVRAVDIQPDNYSCGLIAAIDGATAMSPMVLLNGMKSAEYAAYWSAQYLEQRDLSRAQDARSILLELHAQFCADLKLKFPDAYAAGAGGPAASIAIVLVHGQTVSWAAAGDSVVLGKRKASGAWEQLTEDRVGPFEAQQLNVVKTLGAESSRTAPFERQNFAADEIARRTSRYNMPNGYGVLNVNGDFSLHLLSGSAQLSEFSAYLVLTDGAEWPEPASDESTYIAAAARIEASGIPSYIKELHTLYDTDPTYQHFPRFKHYDDATVATIFFR